ncbi:hypothetical protein TNCV_232531 [Trichonephila clavipes]|nr:hypothetical protein TNCV_232531 [Trichonephila clavipes]
MRLSTRVTEESPSRRTDVRQVLAEGVSRKAMYMGSNLPKAHERVKKNAEGSELAKNGLKHDRQVAKMAPKAVNLVTKNDANLVLSPRFHQVPNEPPL